MKKRKKAAHTEGTGGEVICSLRRAKEIGVLSTWDKKKSTARPNAERGEGLSLLWIGEKGKEKESTL